MYILYLFLIIGDILLLGCLGMIIGKTISDLSKPYNFYFDRTLSDEKLKPYIDNYRNILKNNIKKSIKEIYDILDLKKYNIMDRINSMIDEHVNNSIINLLNYQIVDKYNLIQFKENIVCVNITNDIFDGIKILCVRIINKLFADTSNNIRIECVLEENSISFEIYKYKKINIDNEKISLYEFTSFDKELINFDKELINFDKEPIKTKFYLIDFDRELYDHLKYDILVMRNKITRINTTLVEQYPENEYYPKCNHFIKIVVDDSKPRDLTNVSEEKLINILNQFS